MFFFNKFCFWLAPLGFFSWYVSAYLDILVAMSLVLAQNGCFSKYNLVNTFVYKNNLMLIVNFAIYMEKEIELKCLIDDLIYGEDSKPISMSMVSSKIVVDEGNSDFPP